MFLANVRALNTFVFQLSAMELVGVRRAMMKTRTLYIDRAIIFRIILNSRH